MLTTIDKNRSFTGKIQYIKPNKHFGTESRVQEIQPASVVRQAVIFETEIPNALMILFYEFIRALSFSFTLTLINIPH